MNFERFSGYSPNKKPSPLKMKVGQVVVRECTKARIVHLRRQMRLAMEEAKEFSVAEDKGQYAIRRDR